MYLSISYWNFSVCRLKKHAYAGLSPSENHASQGKNVRTNTRNSAFPRALLIERKIISHLSDCYLLSILRNLVNLKYYTLSCSDLLSLYFIYQSTSLHFSEVSDQYTLRLFDLFRCYIFADLSLSQALGKMFIT